METEAQASFFGIVRRWSTIGLIAGTLLIILSTIGFWIQWYMLSEGAFVDLTTGVISRDEVRDEISQTVIDRLLADFPILRALVRDPLEAVVSAILGSTLFQTAIEFVSTRIWEILFVSGGQVVLNLEPLQNFLYGVISALAPDLAADLSADQMPDELILLDAAQLPDMERVSSLVAWITWLSLFAGVGLVGAMVARAWNQPLVRYALITWAGIFLVVEAIIVAILAIPTRSTIVLAINTSSGRAVVGTTYDMLAQQLHGLLLIIGLIGGALIVGGLWQRRALIDRGTASATMTSLPGANQPQPQVSVLE